jgi:hypothetical protein
MTAPDDFTDRQEYVFMMQKPQTIVNTADPMTVGVLNCEIRLS